MHPLTVTFSTGDLFVAVGGLIGGVTLAFHIAYYLGRLRGDLDNTKGRVDDHEKQFDHVYGEIRDLKG